MLNREIQTSDTDKQISGFAGRTAQVKKQIASANNQPMGITAESLGSESFRNSHGLKYAYVTGAMVRSISSTQLAIKVPMADAIYVEADSGGHTDMGGAARLMPAMLRVRDQMKNDLGYAHRVFVGSAGGIGTPEAASVAFILGADFILTGSINQCTVEAETSDMVKDLLQQMNVQDTDYTPAGDILEMGAKGQVLKKDLIFPGREYKLYELFRNHDSIYDIDPNTRQQLEKSYFKRRFDEVYQETNAYYAERNPFPIELGERNPKHKMGLIFRSYFAHSLRAALAGNMDHKENFQVHTGPALGAFIQWVKGTDLEPWKNRYVANIGTKLMNATATLLNRRFAQMTHG